MSISALERRVKKIPGVNKFYIGHYGYLKECFYSLNRSVHLLKTPIYVHWLTSYDCNFRCKHCEANAGERKADLLTTEDISRAVRDMGKLGVRTFIVTGGEPLLRKDIFEVMALAKDQGIKKIFLGTNGSLVDQFKDPLRKAGLSRVHVSIDGLEDTNDQFRGMKGAFRKALQALDFFKEIGIKERAVSTLIHSGNIHELEDFKKTLLASSATMWNVQLAVPIGRAKNVSSLYLSAPQFRHLVEFLMKTAKVFNVQPSDTAGFLGRWDAKLRPLPFFCGAGLETCSIMPDGEVLGCHIVYDNAYSAGNIKNTSFRSIWEGNMGRFKQPELGENCRSCDYLHACRGNCWGLRMGDRHCLKEIW